MFLTLQDLPAPEIQAAVAAEAAPKELPQEEAAADAAKTATEASDTLSVANSQSFFKILVDHQSLYSVAVLE